MDQWHYLKHKDVIYLNQRDCNNWLINYNYNKFKIMLLLSQEKKKMKYKKYKHK